MRSIGEGGVSRGPEKVRRGPEKVRGGPEKKKAIKGGQVIGLVKYTSVLAMLLH